MRRDILSGLVMLVSSMATQADIHRCEGSEGEPSFSRTPCGSQAATSVASEQRVSAKAGGLRAGETAWLESRQRDRRQAGAKPVPRAKPKQSDDRQAYRCLRERRKLDAVKADLRRGYRPAQGEKLRRRRQAHEDYLAAHCR